MSIGIQENAFESDQPTSRNAYAYGLNIHKIGVKFYYIPFCLFCFQFVLGGLVRISSY